MRGLKPTVAECIDDCWSCQRTAVTEIQTINAGTTDLSDIAQESTRLVCGKSLPEAVQGLALSIEPPKQDATPRLNTEDSRIAGSDPLAFLFPTKKLSHKRQGCGQGSQQQLPAHLWRRRNH